MLFILVARRDITLRDELYAQPACIFAGQLPALDRERKLAVSDAGRRDRWMIPATARGGVADRYLETRCVGDSLLPGSGRKRDLNPGLSPFIKARPPLNQS